MLMREAQDRDYKNIAVGDEASFETTITAETVSAFATLSGDYNPLHVDSAFGAQSSFGHTIPHGMIGGAFFSRLVGMELPGKHALYLSQILRFAKPLPLGTVIVKGVVTKKTDAAQTITLDTTISDSGGEVLVRGEALVRIQPSI
jgi:acyl dehydratase